MNIKCCRNNGKHPAGFSIIEFIAILIILAVVAVVAVTRYTSQTYYNVTVEAEILKANLRYAQFRAMSDADTAYGVNNGTWGLLLSVNSYTLQHKYNGVTANAYDFPGEDSATHVLPAGLNLSGSTATVTFDVWGSPLEGNANITISDGTSSKTVSVTPYTGFIQ
ncbi:MAG TPA: hypothetical protein PK114_02240 [Smithellaceae bacterium]|nr:hypothetical protein [Smithellaceae bacterium]